MDDIAPALLKTLKEALTEKLSNSKKVNQLITNLESGTYGDMYELSKNVGELLSETFAENLSGAVLPDGKMYYNIAKRTVEPMMINNYEIITDAGVIVQEYNNRAAGLE